jgi:hypothetical protein
MRNNGYKVQSLLSTVLSIQGFPVLVSLGTNFMIITEFEKYFYCVNQFSRIKVSLLFVSILILKNLTAICPLGVHELK